MITNVKSKTSTFYVWFALVLAYFFLRYQNIPGVFSEAGLVVPDTDPYYRLYRIQSIVLGSWFYPLFETKLNFPQGLHVAWPLGLDFLIAWPLKLLHVESPFVIQAFSYLIIPILSFPIFIFTALIAVELSSVWVACGCVFFMILMRTLLFQTGVGRLDHHFLEALLPLMFFWLWLKIRKPLSNRYPLFLFSAALALSLSFYPHAWLFFVMLLLVVSFEKDFYLQRLMSNVFFHAFWLSLIPLMFSDRFWSMNIVFWGFSWWGSLVLFFCSLVSRLHFHIRKKTFDPDRIDRLILCIFALFFIGGLVLGKVKGVFQQMEGALSWLHADQNTLQSTKESWSPLRFSFSGLHDIFLIFGMPFVFVWFVYKKKHTELLLYSLYPILLTFFQIRFMAMASPWIAILIVLFLTDLISHVFHRGIHKVIAVSILIIAISTPYFPTLGITVKKTHNYLFYPVRSASIFLREKEKKAQPSDHAVLATWDYGHWILFFSGLPVVATPFQTILSDQTLTLFGSEDENDLEKFRANVPFRYLLVENSVRSFDDAIMHLGNSPENYFEVDRINANEIKVHFKNHSRVFFYDRMLNHLGATDDGNFSSHLRLVYVSPLPSPDNVQETSLKIFEYVPGVTIRYISAEKGLKIRTTVGEKDWNTQHVLMQNPEKKGKEQQWSVPYANYENGGVVSNGVYQIVNARGKVIVDGISVSEKQIQEGANIQIH